MPWAISAASSSGCLISWMFSWMFALWVMRPSCRRRRSASAPRRPMTMPGTGRVDVDAEPVAGPLDLDAAHRRGLELGHQVVADLPVLDHRVLVAAVVEPARLPVGRDTEAEPVGVDLLSHQFVSSRPASRRRSAEPSSRAVRRHSPDRCPRRLSGLGGGFAVRRPRAPDSASSPSFLGRRPPRGRAPTPPRPRARRAGWSPRWPVPPRGLRVASAPARGARAGARCSSGPPAPAPA